MAEKVLMLALSPTMERGTIVKWRKAEGEEVKNGDVLCEVETDKATMEYESVNEGTLLKLLVSEGKDAGVGEPIAIVGRKGEDVSRMLGKLERPPAREAGGAAVPEAARAAGGGGDGDGGQAAAGAGGETKAAPSAGTEPPSGRVRSSPLARTLALAAGIDIRKVRGSGPEGRVVKRDVERARAPAGAGSIGGVEEARVPEAPGFRAPAPPAPATIPAQAPFVEVPVSGKRKVIARRLAESMFSAPHYYLKSAVRVDGLLDARRNLNEGRAEKVSLNAFLLRLVAETLKIHPGVNASWQGDRILRFLRADIGLAVAQPDGLITPIVRDSWNKTIAAIDGELKALIDRAMKNALKPEEYTGATFTVSNLGSYGIDEFTAIINPPGSAILAVGKAERTPVAGGDGPLTFETRMVLTLSCDHRVIDGAAGALFMRDLKRLIEYPIGVLF